MSGTERQRRIGRYIIDQVVGTGAFATVYRATDERLGTVVAIKLLADNHCLDPDIRARFIAEGRALRRVDSPHVLRVYDAGETEQLQPYLVVEHADRGTLAQRVTALRASGWRPGPDDLRMVVTELAAAVEAVHAADLVHRDLSPGNVLLRSAPAPAPAPSRGRPLTPLVTPDERLVVADLGLAKDLARNSGLTVAGGTDGFRPPEQRSAPARIDGRADLWALSAVLSWLVTGQAPDGDAEQADRQLARAIAELSLPAQLRVALLTSLADDPARRHPDVAAWRGAVLGALAPPPPPPPPTPAPPPGMGVGVGAGAPPVPPAPRSRPAVAARVLALVLAGAAAGAAVTGLWVAAGGDGGSGGDVTQRRLEGGDVELTATDPEGDARLVLVGPEEAAVGDTVTFTARADGVDGWVWLMPDGTVYADEPSVQLRTRSAGTAEIALMGTAPSGERLEVVHELHLAEDGG